MVKTFAILAVFAVTLGSVVSSAQEQPKSKAAAAAKAVTRSTAEIKPEPPAKPLIIPDFSKVEGSVGKSSKFKANANCTTPDGRSLDEGDVGFEDCVAAARTPTQRSYLDQKKDSPDGLPKVGYDAKVNF